MRKTERYVFVATNIDLPYWQEAQAGFLTRLNNRREAEMIGPVKYDPASEAGMFQDVIEKQPAGICLSAAAGKCSRPGIDKAISAGFR